jgi:hypothetical protein
MSARQRRVPDVTEIDAIENRLFRLEQLRHWYQETKNPLYVWEAIARGLHADSPPAIPEWCLDYIREAAGNMYDLSHRKDFRDPKSPAFKLSTKRSFELVPQALCLSKRGQKNAFASLVRDREHMGDANTYMFYGKNIRVVEQDRERRKQKVSKNRTEKIIARGKRLLRQGLAPKG